MKRSPMPPRTTPLTASTGLRRGKRLARTTALASGTPLERHTGLKPRSDRTARIYVRRRAIVAEMFLYPDVCEVPWCSETATDPHEPLTRARGGDILDRDNIRKVCHLHNWLFGQCEEPWMYELGFLVHSWDAPAGDAA